MPETAALDPAIVAILKRPFNEQVAFFRGKLGNLVPTERWTDLLRAAHDRAFMVAGAQNADLLAGLAASIDKAIAQGMSINDFRKDFAALVERTGWAYNGDFNWRTRTIYSTNISTSYNGGRLAQLREGDFPFWVYVHADGVLHPRPLHVSWNGVTLPPDDSWWKTHYTPNGWGCHCRIVGVRSLADAARYGAVKTQAPDDGIDPATGAPKGIDKGWDYMPGETVADTVRQMAAKTQQWDYVLAKAYMQGVPDTVRDALAIAYRDLPSTADDVRLYAQRILEGRTNLDIPQYKTLGLLTSEQVSQLKAVTGIDAAGFDFALDRYATLHVLGEHGGVASEAARAQRAVTAGDYAKLPEILNSPDAIESAGQSWRTGHPLARFRKRIGGMEYVAVMEVRQGRRMLALDSFYIRQGSQP